LVLTVGLQHRGIDYEPYLGILQAALSEFNPITANVSQRWSRFCLHGIPTNTTPDDVRKEVESLYPSLQMGQTPRWLLGQDRREGKEASTMVITLVGDVTMKSLGASSIFVFNKRCNIAAYISYGPATRCNKCQLYGHPTQRCPATTPTCAVCARPHLTKDHTCPITTCKAGPACTHPPLSCASCKAPHKSTDPNCPTYTKLTVATRESRLQRRNVGVPDAENTIMT